jgi:Transposase DDE domain
VVPEEVMNAWLSEWAKERVVIDWRKLLPKDSWTLLQRWIVERTFSWWGQNRRMRKDYERLSETSEAFIYVAMSRLIGGGWHAFELFRQFPRTLLENSEDERAQKSWGFARPAECPLFMKGKVLECFRV